MYDNTSGWNRYYFLADQQGSITAITNNDGSINTTYTYDAYGLRTASEPLNSRFAYTGQTWLQEIGMYYYKARLYNPAIGRFMQTDPIGYDDGINWYAYTHNDPVNSRDPSGLDGDPPSVTVTGYRNCYASACYTGDAAQLNRKDVGQNEFFF